MSFLPGNRQSLVWTYRERHRSPEISIMIVHLFRHIARVSEFRSRANSWKDHLPPLQFSSTVSLIKIPTSGEWSLTCRYTIKDLISVYRSKLQNQFFLGAIDWLLRSDFFEVGLVCGVFQLSNVSNVIPSEREDDLPTQKGIFPLAVSFFYSNRLYLKSSTPADPTKI